MEGGREREREKKKKRKIKKQNEEITEEKNGRNTSVVLQSSLLTLFSLFL
jgi:hypothetical protein